MEKELNLTGEMEKALHRGVDLFNNKEFWEAHEAWEKIWLEVEGKEKKFLQGLIQWTAGYHQWQRGIWNGALRNWLKGEGNLEGLPMDFGGIDRSEVACDIERRKEWIERGIEEGDDKFQDCPELKV